MRFVDGVPVVRLGLVRAAANKQGAVLSEGSESNSGKPWFVFEVGDPSEESRAMVITWLASQGGPEPLQDDLVELICTDPRDPYDLEGCIHLVVSNGDVEAEELVDLTGAIQLGVLEEVGSEHGPYNVMAAVSLRREGDIWTTAGDQQ